MESRYWGQWSARAGARERAQQLCWSLRGGGWRDDSADLLNPARELLVTPKSSTEDYGFRCILVLKAGKNSEDLRGE